MGVLTDLAARRQSALAGALAILALITGAILGRASATHPRPPAPPVPTVDGIPLGTQHTRAGALAAADNYLAIASQAIEQNPAQFTALVSTAYAPAARASALSSAAQLRATDRTDMANYSLGGRGLAIIAARRLDSYTPTQAKITTWLAGLIWGPTLAPRQTWNLVDSTLIWRAGRWLVLTARTDATPAPVPSIVYVDGANNQTSAFNTRLAAMTAPYYGSG